MTLYGGKAPRMQLASTPPQKWTGGKAPRLPLASTPPQKLPAGKASRLQLSSKAALETIPPIDRKAPRKQLASKPPRKSADEKPIRFRSGTIARKEIRKYKKNPTLLIDKLKFQKLVRQILQTIDKDLRMESHAVTSLQEAVEMYTTDLFNEASQCTTYSNRSTMMPMDIQLTRRIRGDLS